MLSEGAKIISTYLLFVAGFFGIGLVLMRCGECIEAFWDWLRNRKD